VVINPKEAHADAYSKILNERRQFTDAGAAGGIAQRNEGTPKVSQYDALDWNHVFRRGEEQTIAAERELIYRWK
jgi:hypothetical protein